MKIWSVLGHCREYYSLCKPKVIAVMLVTSWVGMCLACKSGIPWHPFIFGTIGIALAAASSAIVNHLIDAKIDAKMQRTAQRPIASGRILPKQAIFFSTVLGITGLLTLLFFVNFLTAILTLSTMLGYAVLYSLFLKHASPQNIVIGGIAGAAPPLLGWASVTNEINAYALLLVLIIFAWTPPHFWSLAIYRSSEYRNANVPMLPVTHGIRFTKLSIVLYTLLLIAITLLPFAAGMSGLIYLISALVLGIAFLLQTLLLYYSNKELEARKTFGFSIVYLLCLFLALLVDHYF